MGIGKDFEDISPICGFSNDLLGIEVSQDLIKFDASQFKSEKNDVKPDLLDEIFNECFNETANKQNDGFIFGQNEVNNVNNSHHVYPSSDPQYSINYQFQNDQFNSNNHTYPPNTQTTKQTDFSPNETLPTRSPHKPVPKYLNLKYLNEPLRQKPLPRLPSMRLPPMHQNSPGSQSPRHVKTPKTVNYPEKRKFLVNESTLEISTLPKKQPRIVQFVDTVVDPVVDPVEFKRIQTENKALKRKYQELEAFVETMLSKKQEVVDGIVKDHAKSIQKRLCGGCKRLKLDDFEYILSSDRQKKDEEIRPKQEEEEIRRFRGRSRC